MKIYRNHYTRDMDESDGYLFFSTKKDATEDSEAYGIECVEVATEIVIPAKPTKKKVIELLNTYASHSDNG